MKNFAFRITLGSKIECDQHRVRFDGLKYVSWWLNHDIILDDYNIYFDDCSDHDSLSINDLKSTIFMSFSDHFQQLSIITLDENIIQVYTNIIIFYNIINSKLLLKRINS